MDWTLLMGVNSQYDTIRNKTMKDLNYISFFLMFIVNDENKITFISSDNEIEYEKKSKDDVSRDIFKQIIKRCLKE